MNSLRQTAIGIATGHRLGEHQNTDEITVQLLSGRARVVAGSDEVILAVGASVGERVERGQSVWRRRLWAEGDVLELA